MAILLRVNTLNEHYNTGVENHTTTTGEGRVVGLRGGTHFVYLPGPRFLSAFCWFVAQTLQPCFQPG